MNIGLDILGGDFAPDNPLEGAALAYKELPDNYKLVLIGDSEVAKSFFRGKGIDPNLFDYAHTTEIIGMGEHATKAFSQKPKLKYWFRI
jgi:glycerol-3-phosphate acyltransferase PlsX